jgi:signal transduction histidine kinase
MNRISLRIFLGIWLTLLAVIIVTVGIVVALVAGAPQAGEPAPFMTQAASALARDGREGLRRWLAGPGQDLPYFLVYVLDDAGRDLLGRTPVGPVRSWPVWQGGPLPGAPGVTYAPGNPMPTLTGADGARYAIVTLPPPWSPFRALARPLVFAVVVGAALSLTALVSWLVALSMTRPIRDLKRHTEHVRGGDLARPIPAATLNRGDEIGDLGRSFASMTAHLGELVGARERLLRDVSHELRSPLARIRLALALARQPGADVDTQLVRLETDAQRMDDLITQILALSRLGEGSSSFSKADVDLAELVDRIAADADFEARSTGRRVQWAAPQDPVLVTGNEHWLGAAIENVVRNAVRYGPAGQAIEINLTATEGRASVRVRDHGSGVGEAELTRIFEPFYRTASARERESGGEGLGLAITERVMRLHGGSTLARNSPDGGFMVELTLPAITGMAPR